MSWRTLATCANHTLSSDLALGLGFALKFAASVRHTEIHTATTVYATILYDNYMFVAALRGCVCL